MGKISWLLVLQKKSEYFTFWSLYRIWSIVCPSIEYSLVMWCILYTIFGSLDFLRIWHAARTSYFRKPNQDVWAIMSFVAWGYSLIVRTHFVCTFLCKTTLHGKEVWMYIYICMYIYLYVICSQVIYSSQHQNDSAVASHFVIYFSISILLILSMHAVYCILILWFLYRCYS